MPSMREFIDAVDSEVEESAGKLSSIDVSLDSRLALDVAEALAQAAREQHGDSPRAENLLAVSRDIVRRLNAAGYTTTRRY